MIVRMDTTNKNSMSRAKCLEKILNNSSYAIQSWTLYYGQLISVKDRLTDDHLKALRNMHLEFTSNVQLIERWVQQIEVINPDNLDEISVERVQRLVDHILTYKGAYTKFILNGFVSNEFNVLYGGKPPVISDEERLILKEQINLFTIYTKHVNDAVSRLLYMSSR